MSGRQQCDLVYVSYKAGRTVSLFATAMIRLLQDWTFSQVGGSGEGANLKDGEWLKVSQFPTTVHVELQKLNKIPDPVRAISQCRLVPLILALVPNLSRSSSGLTSGMFNVCLIFRVQNPI
jgi:hypothetical protein